MAEQVDGDYLAAQKSDGAIRVALVASTHPWREDFGAYVTEHEARLDLHTIRDPGLLQMQKWAVIIVDDTVPFLDAVVNRIGPETVVVGVVAPNGEGAGVETLRSRGIAVIVEDGSDPAALTSRVLDLARDRGFKPRSPHRLRAVVNPPASPAGLDRPAQPSPRLSSLLAVGGPNTRLSIEAGVGFSAALAENAPSVLIDLDPQRLLAIRLGMQLQPNLRDLASALARKTDVDPFGFFGRRQISNVALPFWTLVGPASPDREASLEPAETAAVLRTAALTIPYQVALIGDPRAGCQGSWTPAVARAAMLVGVTDPTPIGLAELVDWWVAVRADLAALPAMHVVFVGEVDAGGIGRLQAELAESLPASAVASTHHLELKTKQLQRAQWQGGLVGHRFRRRCSQLLGALSSAPMHGANRRSTETVDEPLPPSRRNSSPPKADGALPPSGPAGSLSDTTEFIPVEVAR